MKGCENCVYYVPDHADRDGAAVGRCWRFPPVWTGADGKYGHEIRSWNQPMVVRSTTCGEWKGSDYVED